MPSAPPNSAYKVGLVGTGIHLVQAIESLRAIPGVTIAIVVDASDRSEGGKLAKSLQLPVVKNAMEVFKTDANFVLEVSGDERAYERLLLAVCASALRRAVPHAAGRPPRTDTAEQALFAESGQVARPE